MPNPKDTRDCSSKPGSKELEPPCGLDMNGSLSTVGLLVKARQSIGERWNDENREAVSEFNARIAAEGLPLAKYRTF